ncbi:Hypothetical protein R9X50_00324900 [Acrodontium crateriforme]|uniref:Phosphoglycerate mutase-like protein n=1 Tax=Acrodontium crateriforme TaxID=150365 RepID=A0AAQ3M8P8_9PEZI|nr:Hypothetical protein R9X50_00324900 [Acrodontium crateriforme]
MGKPRLIILIRHAQSEGNKNREIHQMIPDHRVKLTDEGWKQAEDAGRRLRHLLRPDDTLQIFTSPYRRTRETTEGLLKTLTARDDPDDPLSPPSPFSRSKIKVYEEPRIREQDFGNFQPCSAEMERMWQERADYGHFFYRIPDGESAADAYDRISGFNESLWRQFGEETFPSVCVLVTHGLMTRVFLMKWYHWSVEYFEDLRNINHCEFILMKQNQDNGKFVLDSQLRTWSELKRQKAEQAREQAQRNPQRRNTLSSFLKQQESPSIPPRKWGGCIGGCNHHHERFPRREQSKDDALGSKQLDTKLPPPASDSGLMIEAASIEMPTDGSSRSGNIVLDGSPATLLDSTKSQENSTQSLKFSGLPKSAAYVLSGRDGGGSASGTNTPHERSDDESTEYFGQADSQPSSSPANLMGIALSRRPKRQATPEDIRRWANESGMGRGERADGLGDEPDDDEAHRHDEVITEHEEVDEEMERAERENKGLRGSVY